MKSLRDSYKKFIGGYDGQGDKGTSHAYIDAYDALLRHRNIKTMLEIGVCAGHSVKMWQDYWPDCRIFGIDKDTRPIKFDGIVVSHVPIPDPKPDKIIVFEGLSNQDGWVNACLEKIKFDFILDDGSHNFNDQVISFEMLKSRMNPGGVYIIEDILDIDAHRNAFKALHDNCSIYDLREIKNRYDDVLVVYEF